MRILQYRVTGQNLSKVESHLGLVRGSKGYLKCRFTFDDDWHGLKKVAIFRTSDGKKYMPIVGGFADVPDAVTVKEKFYVSVIGQSDDQTITTGEIMERQDG